MTFKKDMKFIKELDICLDIHPINMQEKDLVSEDLFRALVKREKKEGLLKVNIKLESVLMRKPINPLQTISIRYVTE